MTHRYRLYGLDLECDHEIPFLLFSARSESPAPISIVTGRRPDWVHNALALPVTPVPLRRAVAAGDFSSFALDSLGADRFFRLRYGDGTTFVVDSDARLIWGVCPPPFTPEDLATYLVGPVMGFVLRRRGILALHASCFCAGNQAFALCGGASTGKSTTAAAMALTGVPILCEDIAALRELHANFLVAPGYPRINLWPDSAAALLGKSRALPRITPNWDKQFLSLDGTVATFEPLELPLAAIYVLDTRSASDNAPRIEDVSQGAAALLLVQNTYMNYLLDQEQRALEFDAVTRLAARVPVKRVTPSSDPAKLTALCELLRSDSQEIAAASSMT